MNINIFSSRFLGCQKHAINTQEASIRHPIQLIKTAISIIAAVLFKRYKVVVVDSNSATSYLQYNTKKLELISLKTLKENNPSHIIETESENNHTSFFRDMNNNIYQARCDKKDHKYHITDIIIKSSPTPPHSDEHYDKNTHDITSNTSDFDEATASSDDETLNSALTNPNNADKHKQTITENSLTVADIQKKSQSNKDNGTAPVDKKYETITDGNKESRSRITNNFTLFSHNQKYQKFDQELQNEPPDSLIDQPANNPVDSISAEAVENKPENKGSDVTNNRCINVFQKSPEIYEIAEDENLFNPPVVVDDQMIKELENNFNDNPDLSLGDFRKFLIYYNIAIMNNTGNPHIDRLQNLRISMGVSLSNSGHDFVADILLLEGNVFREVIHGYLKHCPNKLKDILTSVYSHDKDMKFNTSSIISNQLSSLIFQFNKQQRTQRTRRTRRNQLESIYTGDPAFRTFQWHYEFSQLNSDCGGKGFYDPRLDNKKNLLEVDDWKKFEDISEKLKDFSIKEFEESTKLLTDIIGSPLSLPDIDARINQLNSTKNNSNKQLLTHLNNYKKTLMIIADARYIHFCFEQKIYLHWDKSLLLNKQVWKETYNGHSLHSCFKQITDIDQLTHPIINEAQLAWIVTSHEKNKGKEDIDVCIEGGGPAGLMSGMTQYKAGANVTIAEKRNTDYNRVQIVRLDQKTMSWLKFYIPQGYIELFPQTQQEVKDVSHAKFGIIKSDGSGLITINELEDKLHKQNTKLSSLSAKREDGELELQCWAMTEIVDVSTDKQGKSFCLMKQSHLELDKDTVELIQVAIAPPEFKKKSFDILICAGGKTSTVGKYLEPVNVTQQQYYGVCTWDTKPSKRNEIKKFDEFRFVLPLDKKLENKLDEQFNEQLSNEEQELLFNSTQPINLHPSTGDTLGKMLVDNIKKSLETSYTVDGNPLRSDSLQTRLFENHDRFYMGMEIPSGYDNWSNTILKNVPEEQKDIAVQILMKCWYQAVSCCFGLNDHGATKDRINTKFSSRFPLQQHRLKKNPVQLGNGLIVAIGDASCAPHFMTAYGMTAVRASVDNAETLTTKIIEAKSKPKAQEKSEITSAKTTYINDQCDLENEVVRKGQQILGPATDFLDSQDIFSGGEVLINTSRQLHVDSENKSRLLQGTSDENDKTKIKRLKQQCASALDNLKQTESEIIQYQKNLKTKLKHLQETKESMQEFLLARRNKIKNDLSKTRLAETMKEMDNKNIDEKATSHTKFHENKILNNIENEKFIKATSQAENITDKVIESMKKQYVETMNENPCFSIKDTEELDHFWDIKTSKTLIKKQKEYLFNSVIEHIINKQNEIIDTFNNSNKLTIDHRIAKRELKYLKTLKDVFFPNQQKKPTSTFLIDVDALSKNNEFDEFAEHLFMSRWNNKKERKSIISVFKNEKDKPILSQLEQTLQKIKLFEPTSWHSKSAFELETILSNLNIAGDEAKKLSGKAHVMIQTAERNDRISKPNVIQQLENTQDLIKDNQNKLVIAFHYLINNTDANTLKNNSLSVKTIEKELNLLTTTIVDTVKENTKKMINEQANKLANKLDISFDGAQQLTKKQMHQNSLMKKSTDAAKQHESSPFLESPQIVKEMHTLIWDNLRNKSAFWKHNHDALKTILQKSENNQPLSDDEQVHFDDLSPLLDNITLQTSFCLQATTGLDNNFRLISPSEVMKIKNIYSKTPQDNLQKKNKKTQLEYFFVPVIVNSKDNVQFGKIIKPQIRSNLFNQKV